jgi:hypothetical protein
MLPSQVPRLSGRARGTDILLVTITPFPPLETLALAIARAFSQWSGPQHFHMHRFCHQDGLPILALATTATGLQCHHV